MFIYYIKFCSHSRLYSSLCILYFSTAEKPELHGWVFFIFILDCKWNTIQRCRNFNSNFTLWSDHGCAEMLKELASLLFDRCMATLRFQSARWMWLSSPVSPCCRGVWCVAGLLLATHFVLLCTEAGISSWPQFQAGDGASFFLGSGYNSVLEWRTHDRKVWGSSPGRISGGFLLHGQLSVLSLIRSTPGVKQ